MKTQSGHGVPGHGVPGHGVPGHGALGHGALGHGWQLSTAFGSCWPHFSI